MPSASAVSSTVRMTSGPDRPRASSGSASSAPTDDITTWDSGSWKTDDATAAIAEEEKALTEIKHEGCEVLTLDATEHAAFVAAVQPLRSDAHTLYSAELLSLLP